MRIVRIDISNFKCGDVFVIRHDANQIYVKRPLRNMNANVQRKHRKAVRHLRQSRIVNTDKLMAQLDLFM